MLESWEGAPPSRHLDLNLRTLRTAGGTHPLAVSTQPAGGKHEEQPGLSEAHLLPALRDLALCVSNSLLPCVADLTFQNSVLGKHSSLFSHYFLKEQKPHEAFSKFVHTQKFKISLVLGDSVNHWLLVQSSPPCRLCALSHVYTLPHELCHILTNCIQPSFEVGKGYARKRLPRGPVSRGDCPAGLEHPLVCGCPQQCISNSIPKVVWVAIDPTEHLLVSGHHAERQGLSYFKGGWDLKIRLYGNKNHLSQFLKKICWGMGR